MTNALSVVMGFMLRNILWVSLVVRTKRILIDLMVTLLLETTPLLGGKV